MLSAGKADQHEFKIIQTMRQSVRFLALSMAILYCASAVAVVDPYEVMQVTPAEGSVTCLQHFTITFGDLPVVVTPGAVPSLQKGGGGSYDGSMMANDEGTAVLVDFQECYTAPGQYFLNLPQGSITVNGQTLLPLSLRFVINGSVESFYEQITIAPAEGEVESLQNFVISLPQYVGEIEYGSMATLTNTTTGSTWQAEMFGVGYNVLMYFSGEITEPGEYTLTIPAGAVIVYTLGEDIHELTFNYTIPGGSAPIPGDVDGDGTVSITDVTVLIDILLGGDSAPVSADVDGDDVVSITDVTVLIDMLLKG